MTLDDLRSEFIARGFRQLTATGGYTRVDRYLNAALTDICEGELWPFLESTATGTAPLTITDLGVVESVINTTESVKLHPLDRRNLTDNWDTNLATVGSPQFWYLTNGATVNTYPTSTTDSLSVRYWKVPTALTNSTDTPILPSRFHSLIVDGAVARAYENSDEFAASQQAQAAFQARLNQMRESLLVQQADEPDDYIQSYAPDADLVGW